MDKETKHQIEIKCLGTLDDIVTELATGEYVIPTFLSEEEAKQIRDFIKHHKENL